jgi:PAS domain S-box-containing protein
MSTTTSTAASDVAELDWWPILDTMSDAVVVVQPASGVVLEINRAACALIGLPRHDLLGASTSAFDPLLAPRARQALDGGDPVPAVWQLGGSGVAVDLRFYRRPTPTGQVVVVVAGRTGSLNSSAVLLDPAQSWWQLLRSIPDYVTVVDRDLKIQFTNRDAPPSEASTVGTEVLQWVPRGHRGRVRGALERVLETGEPVSLELNAQLDDGTIQVESARLGPVMNGGQVVGVTAVSSDVTGRHQRERERASHLARVHHSQRLEALGRLLSGITNDINNPLTVLLSQLDHLNLLATQRQDPALMGPLGEALTGARRISGVMESFRPFAKFDGVALESVHLPEVIDGAVRIAGHQVRHRTLLQSSYAPDLPRVLANPGQLGQVVLNLVLNALQAVPHHGAEHVVTLSAFVRDGRVVVRVRDSGAGVPLELRERIFEPFFTTRPVGQATGLGLSSARTIAESLGGTLQLVLDDGPGACFEVTVPTAPVTTRPPVRERSRDLEHARLVVVDDEGPILRMVRRLLRGVDVRVAGSGEEGVSMVQSGHVDLVLCDVMMPDLDGRQVYEIACAARPELADRFVFMTGGVLSQEMRAFLHQTGSPLLRKPFEQAALLAAMREGLLHR